MSRTKIVAPHFTGPSHAFSKRPSTTSINTFSTIVRVPTTYSTNAAHSTTTVAPAFKTYTTFISTLITLTVISVVPTGTALVPGGAGELR
ncbi:hypothetical protein B7463_g9884, partial [Scytalidium lignicola]